MRTTIGILCFATLSVAGAEVRKPVATQQDLAGIVECMAITDKAADESVWTSHQLNRYIQARPKLSAAMPDGKSVAVFGSHPVTLKPGILVYSKDRSAKFYPLGQTLFHAQHELREDGVYYPKDQYDAFYRLCDFGKKCTVAKNPMVQYSSASIYKTYLPDESLGLYAPTNDRAKAKENSAERLYGWEFWDASTSDREMQTLMPLTRAFGERIQQLTFIPAGYKRWICPYFDGDDRCKQYQLEKAKQLLPLLNRCEQALPQDSSLRGHVALMISYMKGNVPGLEDKKPAGEEKQQPQPTSPKQGAY